MFMKSIIPIETGLKRVSLILCIAILLFLCILPPFRFSRAAETDPVLVLSTSAIDFGTVGRGEETSRILEIRNGGQGDLEWLITGSPPWISVNQPFGRVEHEADTLELKLVGSFLSPGIQSGNLVITSTAGRAVVSVSAVLLDRLGELQVKTERVESWKIFIEPEKIEIEAGKSAMLKARVEYADGYKEDITQSVDWSSSNPFVARFTGPGLLEGISRGTVEVKAKLGDVFSPVIPVSVSATIEPVLSVDVEAVNLGRVEQGRTAPFKLSVTNRGKAPLFFEILSEVPWIRSDRDASIWSYLRETRKATAVFSPGVYLGCPESSLETEDFEPYFRWREARRQVETPVASGETIELSLEGETSSLEEGDHAGSLLIRSNAGEKRIEVKIGVVRLLSIAVSPVEIRMSVGQRRIFRAVGTWSDGRKTDLSGREEGPWVVSDRKAGSFLVNKPVFIARKEGTVTIRKKRGNLESDAARVEIEDSRFEPVLILSPQEQDLGAIGPGEEVKGIFLMENGGSGTIEWMTSGPDGWAAFHSENMAGTVGKESGNLHFKVASADLSGLSVAGHEGEFLIELTLESGGKTINLWKYFPPGPDRMVLPVDSSGGLRHVYIRFTVAREASRPRLAIDPPVMDFGSLAEGKRAVQRIQVLNKGLGVLNWKAVLSRGSSSGGEGWARRGIYLSFRNGEIPAGAMYKAPGRIEDRVTLGGMWENAGGYPAARGLGERLTFSFMGTGIVLLVEKEKGGGLVRASVDGGPAVDMDLNVKDKERGVFPVARFLEEGPHTLDIVSYGGRTVIEGVRVLGENPRREEQDWVRIYPDNGTTTKEKDFVNVAVNTKNLSPGLYGSTVVFTSNSGTMEADISLEVPGKETSPYIDIFAYRKGFDCYFTPRSGEESPPPEGYEFQGVAFRLFRKGTPGTTGFFRWYHRDGNHYIYSYDRNGEGLNLEGYQFEGSIGNIATSRLSGSRELYRWIDPLTGVHFYSTDLREERVIGKGYRYDGISGYVR